MRTLAIVVPAFWSKTKFEPVRAKFKNIKVVGLLGGANHRKTPVRVCQRQESHTFFGRIKTTKRLVSSSGFNDIDFRTKQPVKPFYKHPTFMFRVYPGKREVVQDSYTWNIVLRIIYKIIAKFLDRRQPPKATTTDSPIHRTSDKYILTTKTKLGFLKENEIDGLVDNRHTTETEAPYPEYQQSHTSHTNVHPPTPPLI